MARHGLIFGEDEAAAFRKRFKHLLGLLGHFRPNKGIN